MAVLGLFFLFLSAIISQEKERSLRTLPILLKDLQFPLPVNGFIIKYARREGGDYTLLLEHEGTIVDTNILDDSGDESDDVGYTQLFVTFNFKNLLLDHLFFFSYTKNNMVFIRKIDEKKGSGEVVATDQEYMDALISSHIS